jgi:hypothetical protein
MAWGSRGGIEPFGGIAEMGHNGRKIYAGWVEKMDGLGSVGSVGSAGSFLSLCYELKYSVFGIPT